jgi:hypothetical protein
MSYDGGVGVPFPFGGGPVPVLLLVGPASLRPYS